MTVQERSYASSQDYRISSIISEAFGVLMTSPAKFLAAGSIGILPAIVGYAVSGLPALAPGAGGSTGWFVVLAAVVFGYVAQAAMTFGAFEILRGRTFDLGNAVSSVFGRIVTIFLLSLAVGLLVGLGSAALIVPGLMLMCMWYVALPVCVVERAGIGESMSRSRLLTKGCRWKILGQVLVVAVPFYLVIFLIAYLTARSGQVGVSLWIQELSGVVMSAVLSVLGAVTYFRLRSLQEGVDLERIAAVFD